MVRKIEEGELLDRLSGVFRLHGYEGASLSRLTQATGLKRASLYHRFPGGKEEMAAAVLERVSEVFQQSVMAPAEGPGDPAERIRRIAEQLLKFYGKGNRSCLLDTLSLGESHPAFRAQITSLMSTWISIFQGLAQQAGLPEERAKQNAEEAVLRIQGALILARTIGQTTSFQRVLETLPRTLLT